MHCATGNIAGRGAQIQIAQKELERSEIAKENAVTRVLLQVAQKDVLRSKSLRTSRGVFEFHLKQVHYECGNQARFNAQSTCRNIANIAGRGAQIMREDFELILSEHRGSSVATKPIGEVYGDMYHILSEEIHGHVEWRIGKYIHIW
jgi:hypothetical protein